MRTDFIVPPRFCPVFINQVGGLNFSPRTEGISPSLTKLFDPNSKQD